MQKLKAYQLTKLLLVFLCCTLLWLSPATNSFCAKLDTKFAIWLNQSLEFSHAWQLFWGYLNHQNETWLNVVLMAGINLAAIFTLPKQNRAKATLLVGYFWLFFQLVLLCTHALFTDILHIQRQSPSLAISPWLSLSDLLHMERIKVYAYSCFPAGHALVLVFWAQFTMFIFQQRWMKYLSLSVVMLLTLPRLISGAHWLSDVLFTTLYAMLWFNIAKIIATIRVKHEERIY